MNTKPDYVVRRDGAGYYYLVHLESRDTFGQWLSKAQANRKCAELNELAGGRKK